jgi:Domain of unknown function (DUF4158)
MSRSLIRAVGGDRRTGSGLPWLGFVPDEVRAAPPAAVARLAQQLGLDPAVLAGYGQRAHTRSDHVRLVAGYLGWKSVPAGSAAVKDLEQFLLDRATEHDSPGLLFTVAAEYLISAKTIRPGVVILAKMVAGFSQPKPAVRCGMMKTCR